MGGLLPQHAIDTWHVERRKKDRVASFQDKAGFYMKGGRDGYIYYVDTLGRICEIGYEMLGVVQSMILPYMLHIFKGMVFSDQKEFVRI